MPYVSVYIDVDDVIKDLDTEDLVAELADRRKKNAADAPGSSSMLADKTDLQLLEAIYLQQRDAGSATLEMREYIARTLGRIL